MREKALKVLTKAAADGIGKMYNEGKCANLSDILDAREERVRRQQALIQAERQQFVALQQLDESQQSGSWRQFAGPQKPEAFSLISFTLNIAGAVKSCSLFSWAFDRGVDMISESLAAAGIETGKAEINEGIAGCEYTAIAFAEPEKVKLITAETEELHPLGRIFDIDVIRPDGTKVSRTDLGASGRTCILCGKPAFICGRSRAHSTEEVLGKQIEIMASAQADETARRISGQAVNSLLAEVHVGPKPGLVDRFNSGAHMDMDESTFIRSAESLRGYFTDCAYAGIYLGLTGDESTMDSLVSLGKDTEKTMLSATGGINTHKGAIFSMGIFACAAGMSEASEMGDAAEVSRGAESGSTLGISFRENVLRIGRKLSGLTVSDDTAGARIKEEHGIGGIRSEAAAGYPTVFDTGLPVLKAGLASDDTEAAALKALTAIIAEAEDTNVISRGGTEAAKWLKSEAAGILKKSGAAGFDIREALADLDRKCIEKNISPGGSADLLGLCLFASGRG
jgi:holo-ACP synthase/triphosphoribosyl-dephospho-CoA synthase